MHTWKHAKRQLFRRAWVSGLSIGLLGLGVGLAASFYSVLESALIGGLPFDGGDRLVAFSTREAAGWPMPVDDFRTIEATQRSFEWIAPLRTFNTMITRRDRTRGLLGSYVTADLFERFGVEPILGRSFRFDDEDPAQPPVALISHRLWQGVYGADPEIIGEQIVLNREPTIVIGVMPAGFRFPLRHDVWGIFREHGREWSQSFVFGLARLADDTSLDTARRDLNRIAAQLNVDSPQPDPRGAQVERYVDANIGDSARGALRAMVLAALALLALTSANLANLRLGESLRRSNEFDTRMALGSGRLGVFKLIVAENALIGFAGLVAALGVAWFLTETLKKTLLAGGGYLERIYWIDATVDRSVVGFALVAVAVATLVGSTGAILSALLGDRRLGRGRSRSPRSRFARALVGVQVGMCFAMLVAAGLFGQQAQRLLAAELGFRPEGLSSLRLSTYQAFLEEEEQLSLFFERFRTELEEHPEVEHAAFASNSPWSHVRKILLAPGTELIRDTAVTAEVLEVSEGFFETLELPQVVGQGFTVSDFEFDEQDVRKEELGGSGARAPARAMLSRSLARRLFGDQQPIDQLLTLGGVRREETVSQLRVVGVVADLDVDRSDRESRNLTLYLPDASPAAGSFLLIRTAGSGRPARPSVEETLERIDPRVGTLDELSVEHALTGSIWVERRLAQILTIFGTAAMGLTGAGMYAVIALMVRSREQELGIRAAIGARPFDLQRLVLGECGRQYLAGLTLGLAILGVAHRLLDATLARGLGWQPTILFGAAVLVGSCCLLASWRPVRRAASIDPADCLRSE